MLLDCKDGAVLATHDDNQGVPAASYGAGVVVIPVTSLAGLSRGGDAPSPGQPDTRRYAMPEITPTILITHAAFARYMLEIGGIVVSGKPVATDRGSQGKIAGELLTVQANPSATIQWKYADR